MILAMAKRADDPIIHVVRRDAQVELLESLGAEHVLNSSDAGFPGQLRAACARPDVTTALEAVGGDMTGSIINLMPPGSTVDVYGAL